MEDIEYLTEHVYSVQFASMPDFTIRMQASKFIPHTNMEDYPTVQKKIDERKTPEKDTRYKNSAFTDVRIFCILY